MPQILVNPRVGRIVFLSNGQIGTANVTRTSFVGENIHVSFVEKGHPDNFASLHTFPGFTCDSLRFHDDTNIRITEGSCLSPNHLTIIGNGNSRLSFMSTYRVEELDVSLCDTAYIVTSRRPINNTLPSIVARRATCVLRDDSILSRLDVTHTMALTMSEEAIVMVVLESTLRSLVFAHPCGTPIACFYNVRLEPRRVQCDSCPSREGCRCQFDTVKGAREFFTRHMASLQLSTLEDFSQLPTVARPSRALTAL